MSTTLTVNQGATIRILNHEELECLISLLKTRGVDLSCIDASQMIITIPKHYIGYIGLPQRRIIIKPKHENVTFSHILRIYMFLHSIEYSDIDTPMYDVEPTNNVDVIAMFVKELLMVIHKGIPLNYVERQATMRYAKGKINAINTFLNMRLSKAEPFDCEFDELTKDTGINKVLLAASVKINNSHNIPEMGYVFRQFGSVNYSNYPDNVSVDRNTSYCKKAVSLAYMILNDLSISAQGSKVSGESLLINFDRVFEDFIKKILMDYSAVGKFSFWVNPKPFAHYRDEGTNTTKNYLPDLLYDHYEKYGHDYARGILDMKNKTSSSFSNADIYQMNFYSQALKCKKVILCYPFGGEKNPNMLRFDDERMYLQKIYSTYFNLVGNTAAEFKSNIKRFVQQVDGLI